MIHLKKEQKLTVVNVSPGVYHINKETFITQIIVTSELSSKDNLYLRCLTDKFNDMELANRLADDYKKHWNQKVYNRYMQQLAAANKKAEREVNMVINEWLYEMCGTSSDEVIARAKKELEEYYQPKIDQLTSQNDSLASEINSLSSQIDYLKSLLTQHNIPFDLEPEK